MTDKRVLLCISHSRLLILLGHQELHSCSDEKKITINFDCAQDGVYFKCKADKLSIARSDKDASFVMGTTVKPPREIVIESSKMFFIPAEMFKQFSEVKEFIALNNSIEEIYVDTFASAYNLHYLILSYNKIQMLIDNSFSNTSTLHSLKLQHNKIDTLSSHAFFGLKELQILILSFNKIASLPLYLFRDLESLEDLQLDHNFITVISFYQFQTNLDLTTLHLENNKIATIDNGTFENLKKLERVNLNENNCVDKSFAPWRADNQTELTCCAKPFEEVNECLNLKVEKSDNENISSHITLIFILFLSIFGNFLAIFYFLIYKRERGDDDESPEHIELIPGMQNGSAYQVY